jgi:sulfur-carrier protein
MVRVLLFGRLADQAGWRDRAIDLPAEGFTVGALRALISTDAPGVGLGSTRAAVNRALTGDDHPITDGDEIAFMPPMSGG